MGGCRSSWRIEMEKNRDSEKQIACGNVVPGCSFEASAPTEAELLAKIGAHARESHGLSEIPPEIAAKVKQAIRNR